MSRFTGFIFVFLGAILFSTKAILVKLVYKHDVDYATLLVLRMFFALPFYIAILSLPQYRKVTSEIKGKQWYQVIFMGIAGYYLASIFDFAGLKFVTAGMERLILFIYPTLVVLISAIFLKKKIGQIEIVSLLLAYGGIALVVLTDDMGAQKNLWLGTILIFGSALTYAIYLIGSGELIPKLGTVTYTAISMIVSTIVIGIHFLITNKISDLVLPSEVYILSVLMAIFSTVLPSFLISEGIRRVGSAKSSIVGSIGPVSTIILAWIFLGEDISGIQIMGTILVLGGVLLVSTTKKN